MKLNFAGLRRLKAALFPQPTANPRKKRAKRGKRVLTSSLTLGTFEISVTRRSTKYMRLLIAEPQPGFTNSGNSVLKITAPLRLPDQAILEFVAKKSRWIAHHQIKLKVKSARYARNYGCDLGTTSIRHFGLRRNIITNRSSLRAASIKIVGGIEPHVQFNIPDSYSVAQRELLLWRWYNTQLTLLATSMITKWSSIMQVQVSSLKLRRMKTRWGTCHTSSAKIMLNLELARRPKRCVEFVVVHELVHLLEHGHTRRFYALMDKFLPNWRQTKAVLDSVPLR